ncbi:MAG: hypothetical protein GY928_33605 [Colwellia sp.]|nr:hypothetical protein [Colwellia sp.]
MTDLTLQNPISQMIQSLRQARDDAYQVTVLTNKAIEAKKAIGKKQISEAQAVDDVYELALQILKLSKGLENNKNLTNDIQNTFSSVHTSFNMVRNIKATSSRHGTEKALSFAFKKVELVAELVRHYETKF